MWLEGSGPDFTAGTSRVSLPSVVVHGDVASPEPVGDVSMQGWQLAGGCRSPHCLYFLLAVSHERHGDR